MIAGPRWGEFGGQFLLRRRQVLYFADVDRRQQVIACREVAVERGLAHFRDCPLSLLQIARRAHIIRAMCNQRTRRFYAEPGRNDVKETIVIGIVLPLNCIKGTIATRVVDV
jgi:hypothetical protein